MNILITGGCGFIGSNFVLKQVRKAKNNCLNLDNLTYSGNRDNLVSITDRHNYQFIEGNISNRRLVSDTIHTFQPDVIIHFAAESHVDRSIERPMEFIQTNIVGTATLLNACLEYWQGLRDNNHNTHFKFLHVSTDEVFGSLGTSGYFMESTPYAPNSPYSASKA